MFIHPPRDWFIHFDRGIFMWEAIPGLTCCSVVPLVVSFYSLCLLWYAQQSIGRSVVVAWLTEIRVDTTNRGELSVV